MCLSAYMLCALQVPSELISPSPFYCNGSPAASKELKEGKFPRKLRIEVYSPAWFQLFCNVCRNPVKRKSLHIYVLRQCSNTKLGCHIRLLMGLSTKVSTIWRRQTVSVKGAYPKGARVVCTLSYCPFPSPFLGELSIKMTCKCLAWQGCFCRNYFPLRFLGCCNSHTPAICLGDFIS